MLNLLNLRDGEKNMKNTMIDITVYNYYIYYMTKFL